MNPLCPHYPSPIILPIIRVLRKLPDDAFARPGTHNRRGRVTVGAMVKDYIEHVDHHLKFLHDKRQQLGKPV